MADLPPKAVVDAAAARLLGEGEADPQPPSVDWLLQLHAADPNGAAAMLRQLRQVFADFRAGEGCPAPADFAEALAATGVGAASDFALALVILAVDLAQAEVEQAHPGLSPERHEELIRGARKWAHHSATELETVVKCRSGRRFLGALLLLELHTRAALRRRSGASGGGPEC